jgi:hypothetical protein
MDRIVKQTAGHVNRNLLGKTKLLQTLASSGLTASA